MKILGLTGSIGMGKSTTAQMFRDEGVPVYDADAAVHALYAPGGDAVEPVEAAFPGVMSEDGGIDRGKLREKVIGKPDEIKHLESIVHPLLGKYRSAFFEKANADHADIVVMDVPLLFETGGEANVDKVVVVTAAPDIQRERVMAREGMTEDVFKAIVEKQTPDAEKRARADYIIDTGLGMEHARERVRAILDNVRSKKATN